MRLIPLGRALAAATALFALAAPAFAQSADRAPGPSLHVRAVVFALKEGADVGPGFGSRDVLPRLQALSRAGRARIESRLVAVVREGDSATFSSGPELPAVKGGADLFALTGFIQASRLFTITPRLSRAAGGESRFDLDLSYENNSVGGELRPDGLPTVDRQVLQTRFSAAEGEEALVGGFDDRVTRASVRKLPVLGDLPLFGRLFRRRVTSTGREKIYLAVSVRRLP